MRVGLISPETSTISKRIQSGCSINRSQLAHHTNKDAVLSNEYEEIVLIGNNNRGGGQDQKIGNLLPLKTRLIANNQ